ncbi:MAG TPA: hypothetical protein VH328_12150 [Burkholderiaceae bacterium]|nr:hypothetical protein [Burkholderiaceae bacterium]
MLSESAVLALVEGRHDDPFSVLGLHRDGEGALWARALLPQARAVTLHEAASGLRAARLLLRHSDGLWEACVPRRRHRFDYRLHVQWSDGTQGRYADAYAFGLLLADAELERQGTRGQVADLLGAHPCEIEGVDGVRFAVSAPAAVHVSVIGDFNGWDVRRHPLRYRHPFGVWEIFVPHAAAGDIYKFALTGSHGQRLPDMSDPCERASESGVGSASRVVADGGDRVPLPQVPVSSHN